jgi:hypothetical protein
MSQYFGQQNIPNIVKASSSSITLAATNAGQPVSILVGGQAYTPSATLTLSTGTSGAGGLDTGSIAANSTYYVYAVISGGNLALVASLAGISTGPTGFTQWAPIGLFKTLASSTSIDYAIGINPTEPGITPDGTNVFTGATQFTQSLSAFPAGSESRNIIINGNMDFWQRGTSTSVINTYLADRFKTWRSGSYTYTVSRSTDVPTVAQSKFNSQYSLLITNGTGASPTASDYHQITHSIEGQDYQQLHGGKFRFQFWCKSSVAGTYSVCFYNALGNRALLAPFTVSASNTWQKINLDLSADTTGTWNFDNTIGLTIQINLTAGSNYITSTTNQWYTPVGPAYQGITGQTQWGATTGATFQLAQVSLIPIDFSTNPAVDVPFQRAGRTIGDELRMCHRYYEKSFPIDVTPAHGSSASVFSVGEGVCTALAPYRTGSPAGGYPGYAVHRFMVTKRTTPNITLWGNNAGALFYRNGMGSGASTGWVGAAGLITNNAYGFQVSNEFDGTSAVVFCYFHYTADAEL